MIEKKDNKQLRVVALGAIIATFFLCCGWAYYSYIHFNEFKGIKILRFPGTHLVKLNEDEYWIWFFSVWKARELESSEKIYSYSEYFKLVKPGSNQAIELEKVSDDILNYHDDRKGRLIFKCNIRNKQNYKAILDDLKNMEDLIVVIAPRDVHQFTVGSHMSFDGW